MWLLGLRTLWLNATSEDTLETIRHAKCGGLLKPAEMRHAIPATYLVLDADGNRLSAKKTT